MQRSTPQPEIKNTPSGGRKIYCIRRCWFLGGDYSDDDDEKSWCASHFSAVLKRVVRCRCVMLMLPRLSEASWSLMASTAGKVAWRNNRNRHNGHVTVGPMTWAVDFEMCCLYSILTDSSQYLVNRICYILTLTVPPWGNRIDFWDWEAESLKSFSANG